MTSLNKLQLAFRHNSSGILLLQSGNGKAAVQQFKRALEGMNLLLNSEDVTNSDPTGSNGTPPFVLVEAPLLSDDRFYVYNRVIQFAGEHMPLHLEAIAIYSAATLLNLAIAVHHVALFGTKEEDKKRILTRSILIYEAVIGLVKNYDIQNNDNAIFLFAVALNNRALINFDLGQRVTASKQYEFLLKASNELQAIGWWSLHSAEKMLEEFMLNGLFLSSNVAAACA